MAVTAKYPLPDNASLTLFEELDGSIQLTDSISGQNVPYPFYYFLKYYRGNHHQDSTTLPCFLYLFDTPYDVIDTFYLGVHAPMSTWMDTNQLLVYASRFAYYIGDYSDDAGATIIWAYNETLPNGYGYTLYQKEPLPHGEMGPVYPLIGLPCLPPQAPQVVTFGDDSLRLDWDDGGEYYRVRFVNTDLGHTTFITDTFSDNHIVLPDSLLLPGNYEVLLRKACRYTTATYDTLVWSDWGRPASLFIADPPVDTTLAIPTSHLSPLNSHLTIRPNPASDEVTLLSSFGITAVEAYNAAGTLVFSSRDSGSFHRLSDHALSLDLSSWPRGSYLLRIHTPAGTTTKKLLVQ
jgi:hypothetical protein